MSEQINRIVFLTGSGGTHAGLLVGVKALGLNVQVEGIMNFAVAGLREKVMALASDTAKHLGREIPFSDADFVLLDAAGTHGYGVITDSERDAMRLLARTEAIIADPIYTGRALAGLVNRIKQGVYRDEETILFWHTGGIAGLYPRAADVLGLPPQ